MSSSSQRRPRAIDAQHDERLIDLLHHPDKAEWSERVTGQVLHYPGSPNVATRIASAMR